MPIRLITPSILSFCLCTIWLWPFFLLSVGNKRDFSKAANPDGDMLTEKTPERGYGAVWYGMVSCKVVNVIMSTSIWCFPKER
ncbi:MAG: hypothetical protein J3R72DRAFT_434071 [Linnemannia gamsii]|nr:MAG: hypothetical protein J3R72DRAFT_434071 [Linnemannia gamsii]